MLKGGPRAQGSGHRTRGGEQGRGDSRTGADRRLALRARPWGGRMSADWRMALQ
jgi:hypothetical protein